VKKTRSTEAQIVGILR